MKVLFGSILLVLLAVSTIAQEEASLTTATEDERELSFIDSAANVVEGEEFAVTRQAGKKQGAAGGKKGGMSMSMDGKKGGAGGKKGGAGGKKGGLSMSLEGKKGGGKKGGGKK
ncbi:MAG: hypothetical protein SGILL_006695, partial [Bacillariaceae sp.]